MAASTLAPAAGEEGLVNPHIPQFMAKAPWYLQQEPGKGLAHQRRGAVEDQSMGNMEKYYANRGQKVAVAGAYRKGSCKNCGSATHLEKECTERPRKVGAWKTNAGIAADEALPPSLHLGWDAKRDKYAGYDVDEHAKIVAKFEVMDQERHRFEEEERRKVADESARKRQEKDAARVSKAARKTARVARRASKAAGIAVISEGDATPVDDEDFSSTDSEEKGSEKDFSESEEEGTGEGGAGAGGQAKMVSWNVRTREDKAKYLLNLDTDSAFYDPKTRSMRENPFAPDDPRAAQYGGYGGDNAAKASGAVSTLAADQLFAWEAYNRGTDVHLQGNPTQVALLKQQFAARKEAVKALVAKKLTDKYGGSASGADGDVESSDALPSELRLQGTLEEAERYMEYVPAVAPDGRVVTVSVVPGAAGTGGRGGEQGAVGPSIGPSNAGAGPVQSKYPEDVHPGNHTGVYGSWFDIASKTWGFACCHQTLYGSYCTGAAGKSARADAADFVSRAAATQAAAARERTAIAAKRTLEAAAAAREETSLEDARARKRARPGDPGAEMLTTTTAKCE